jgi:hypothetical protein
MAVPMTSCMSEPMMATSVHSHSARRGIAGYCLQFKPKFRLVYHLPVPYLVRYRTGRWYGTVPSCTKKNFEKSDLMTQYRVTCNNLNLP